MYRSRGCGCNNGIDVLTKRAMLESEGLQIRSLQKIQTPGDSNPTQVFIDTARAQRNPTPIDNNEIPVAKEPVCSNLAKICHLLSKKRVRIRAS